MIDSSPSDIPQARLHRAPARCRPPERVRGGEVGGRGVRPVRGHGGRGQREEIRGRGHPGGRAAVPGARLRHHQQPQLVLSSSW